MQEGPGPSLTTTGASYPSPGRGPCKFQGLEIPTSEPDWEVGVQDHPGGFLGGSQGLLSCILR